MTNVVPGDLAYIVGSRMVDKTMTDRIVSVEYRVYHGDRMHGYPMNFRGYTGVVWAVRAANGMLPLRLTPAKKLVSLIKGVKVALFETVPVPDAYLRKITGPSVEIFEETDAPAYQ